jgi:PAS domain S-box-containing protein
VTGTLQELLTTLVVLCGGADAYSREHPMDVSLDGYRFERRLRGSAATEVWTAVRERDSLPVIAKVFSIEDRPGLEARVEHEFELIRRLEVSGVVRALACERSGRRLYLLLEAYSGVDLATFAGGQPLRFEQFFAIACKLTATLAEVHEQRVIHRDIKPTNVLVSADGSDVMLADFGISVLLESERGHIHDPTLLRGTLSYVSPEQTGRTGRDVDFRSDLYSLGVTFYELLTARRPFVAETSLELIHAHLARRPEPPERLRPELPPALSQLVTKLLEKAPERRYQSARGLFDDLEHIRRDFGSGQVTPFEIGRFDVSQTLQLPHQLYGREHAREQLHAALRCALEGPPCFRVVVGDAGVGKSALLDDLSGQVMAHGGRLIRGGFERGRDEPLFGLTLALSSLADQLLTEPPEELARWQRRLLTELGPLAAVVVELAPRFAALLGPHRSAAVQDSNDARNRVQQACVRVLELAADPEHPLLLALDDLQWADTATLDVLDRLSVSRHTGLAVVLTARPEALAPEAAFGQLLAKLEQRGHARTKLLIEVAPLTAAQLTELLADTLSLPRDRVAALAELVARKTGGNPFFVRGFLLLLSERELLRRGPEGWTWTLAELAGAALPEDALELLMGKLARLEPGARELLTAASVLGSEVDAGLLAGMVERDDVPAGLLELMGEGLLGSGCGDHFVFGHGRIREAAYALLDEPARRRWHRAAGAQLLVMLGPETTELRLFDVVEHLDRGAGLWPDAAERDRPAESERLAEIGRIELVDLNLLAGQRALATGVPAAARTYLEIAARLLGSEREIPPLGDALHERAVTVHRQLADAESLTRATASADARLARLLAAELTPTERAEVATVSCKVLIAEAQLDAAVRVVVETLVALGLEIPRHPTGVELARLLPRLLWMVRPAGLERLRELEPLHDARVAAMLDLLSVVGPASFMVSPELFVVLAATAAELSLTHGRHVATPLFFNQIGLVLANALGLRRQAVELNRFCASLAADGPIGYRIEIGGLFARAWVEPLPPLLEVADRADEAALARGDLNSVTIAKSNAVTFAFYGGVHLREVEARVTERLQWLAQWGLHNDAPGGAEVGIACRRLIEGPVPASGELDALGLLGATEGKPIRVELDIAVLTAVVEAAYSRWTEVFGLLDGRIERLEQVFRGSWHVGPARTLWAVACAELAHACSGARQRSLRRKLSGSVTKLAEWTAQGGNFGHLAALLEAEQSVLDADLPRASRLFERARDAALAQQHHMFAALASERHAAAWTRAGHRRLALGPMLDAREHYLIWGAFAKLELLDQQWPELAKMFVDSDRVTSTDLVVNSDATRAPSSSTSSNANRALDIASLLKAAQTLSEDLRVHEVLTRVMAIALENAGADRGVLLLAAKGEITLVAETSVDHTQAFLDAPARLAEVGDRVPASLLHYVQRTGEAVVLQAAADDSRFASDPYFRALSGDGDGGLSALCLPMVKRSRTIGMLYLENRLGTAAFGTERIELLGLLAGYAASALENARLYENLRDSEIRWRSLVDQLPDYVVLVGRNGRLEYINAVARPRQLTGFSFNTREFVTGPDAARVTTAVAEALQEGARAQLEVRVMLSGSDLRWYALRVAPIAIEGEIDRAIVVATDIDDRKRAETERDQLEARLRQQQRLDSIGTLASGVAHEINNPVQGIMNYAELIAGSSAADDMIREFATEIGIETQRVATIVRQLLAFSRQELSEAVEPTAVSELVEGTMSLIRAVMRRDQIQVDIALPVDLPKVACRRQQIHQVIMNLVTNARDALNTRWPKYHEDKRIRIGGEAFMRDGAPWVRVTVSDLAGGVPQDMVVRIFDPFFTTKGRDHGTGLGLAVSHGIVAEHGGMLTLENRPGIGAEFRVELPCAAASL